MIKAKSQIPTILITISSFLTIILFLLLKSKFSNESRPQAVKQAIDSPSPTYIPVTYNIPSPSPSLSPKNLKKETIRRENPDKTLAFYYASDTPAFSHSEKGYEDDPFKIDLNGDTTYFTKNPVYPGIKKDFGYEDDQTVALNPNYQYIVKPTIINLMNNMSYELPLSNIIVLNGYIKVYGWASNSWLAAKSCSGDGGGSGCQFDLIDVRGGKLEFYGSGNTFGLSSFSSNNLVKGYHINQSCEYKDIEAVWNGSRPLLQSCQIEIYKDVSRPIAILKTSKYLNSFQLDDENISTINQKVKFYLSHHSPYDKESIKDGYFIFDLQSGTVMEENNL